MRRLYWILTNKCNLKCRYCYYNTGMESRTHTDFKLQESLDVIGQLPKFFNKVIFTGGEPFLNPGLFELIKECNKQGLITSVSTNGVLLNKENCEKILSLGANEVTVTLDSIDPFVNDSQRGKHEEVFKNVLYLKEISEKKITIEILETISSKNISSIPDMVCFCKANDFTLWINPVDIQKGTNVCDEFSLSNVTIEEIDTLEKNLLDWVSVEKDPKTREYVENIMRMIKGESPMGIVCQMGEKNFVLDVDGNIYPCFLKKNLLLGNVYSATVEEILTDEKTKGVTKDLKKENVLGWDVCV
ncbi:MAG: radical SAM protein [Candidatus Dojkabacteria bacterium]